MNKNGIKSIILPAHDANMGNSGFVFAVATMSESYARRLIELAKMAQGIGQDAVIEITDAGTDWYEDETFGGNEGHPIFKLPLVLEAVDSGLPVEADAETVTALDSPLASNVDGGCARVGSDSVNWECSCNGEIIWTAELPLKDLREIAGI